MTHCLCVENLVKRFRGLTAVDSVSFSVPEGKIFAIIGPNGAGKTTLFNLIAGALRPDAGRIFLESEHIGGLRPDQVCARGVARTFQIVRPFPRMTVLENAMVGAILRTTSVAAARSAAEHALRRLDLFDRRRQLAGSLSLPDRKRLEIGRALATRPKVLLLDEAMAGLRPAETDRAVDLLRAINREDGISLVMIEHVMRAVTSLADRVHVLHHGATLAEGGVKEVMRDPRVIESYLGAEAFE